MSKYTAEQVLEVSTALHWAAHSNGARTAEAVEMLDYFAEILREREQTQSAREAVAWRYFDGEGGYDYTDDEETASMWLSHAGEKYANWVEPLYARPAERAAVPERIDIQRVPVISTRHVSGERFCWLAHKARLRAAERDNGEMPVASYGWGYWLYVPDDWVGVNTHADLSPVFEWFDGLDLGGDRWLRIDADGPVIPGLPIFEW